MYAAINMLSFMPITSLFKLQLVKCMVFYSPQITFFLLITALYNNALKKTVFTLSGWEVHTHHQKEFFTIAQAWLVDAQ